MGLFGKKKEEKAAQGKPKQGAKRPSEKQIQEEQHFVDAKTGKEIREPVEDPLWNAFKKNQKFLNQDTYPADFFQMLFTESSKIKVVRAGEADFPTGRVVLADPIAYLGTRYETALDRKVPAGSYPVELSVCLSRIAGLRIAAARLLLSGKQAVRYEIAMPEGKKIEDLGKPGIFTFLGVDAGLACFADGKVSEENRLFFEKWMQTDELRQRGER